MSRAVSYCECPSISANPAVIVRPPMTGPTNKRRCSVCGKPGKKPPKEKPRRLGCGHRMMFYVIDGSGGVHGETYGHCILCGTRLNNFATGGSYVVRERNPNALPCCGTHRSDYAVEGHGNYGGQSFGHCRRCGKKLHTDGEDFRIDFNAMWVERERKRQAALPMYGEGVMPWESEFDPAKVPPPAPPPPPPMLCECGTVCMVPRTGGFAKKPHREWRSDGHYYCTACKRVAR